MRIVKIAICLLAGLLMLVALTTAEARREGRSPRHDGAHPSGHSLDEAVGQVRRETGGRVLSAMPREQPRGMTYRIKVLLPDSSVRYVEIDAHGRER